MTDVGDPTHVNAKKKRYELEQDRKKDDFLSVMNSVQGRAVLWRILEGCGIYSSSYFGDVNELLMNEGRRKMGLEILAMFAEHGAHGDKAITLMTNEAHDRERKVGNNDS
jgi:hypothetical protein